MKDVLEKLGSYNLFNYLIPGCVFTVIAEHFGLLKAQNEETIVSLIIFYFIGLVISRVGSLLVEPCFKKTGLIKYGLYSDFVKAASIDTKIEVLSEANNMYRTFCAMFASLALLKVWTLFAARIGVGSETSQWFAIFGGLILFAISFKKQSSYITSRVSEATKTVISG